MLVGIDRMEREMDADMITNILNQKMIPLVQFIVIR